MTRQISLQITEEQERMYNALKDSGHGDRTTVTRLALQAYFNNHQNKGAAMETSYAEKQITIVFEWQPIGQLLSQRRISGYNPNSVTTSIPLAEFPEDRRLRWADLDQRNLPKARFSSYYTTNQPIGTNYPKANEIAFDHEPTLSDFDALLETLEKSEENREAFTREINRREKRAKEIKELISSTRGKQITTEKEEQEYIALHKTISEEVQNLKLPFLPDYELANLLTPIRNFHHAQVAEILAPHRKAYYATSQSNQLPIIINNVQEIIDNINTYPEKIRGNLREAAQTLIGNATTRQIELREEEKEKEKEQQQQEKERQARQAMIAWINQNGSESLKLRLLASLDVETLYQTESDCHYLKSCTGVDWSSTNNITARKNLPTDLPIEVLRAYAQIVQQLPDDCEPELNTSSKPGAELVRYIALVNLNKQKYYTPLTIS